MKKTILLILFLLPTFIILAQDTTFFNSYWDKVNNKNDASYYRILLREPADTNLALESMYYASGQMKSQRYFSNYSKKTLDGKYKEWYKDGIVKTEIDYKDGKKSGKLLTYWNNGKPKRIDIYENDKFMEGKCMSSEGNDTTYFEYEEMAKFPGGEQELSKYLIKEIKYPKKSRRKGIEGRVFVRFVVNKDGTISNVKLIKGVHQELDEEAMRVVTNMPKWEPGRFDGDIIKTAFNLPIRFSLK